MQSNLGKRGRREIIFSGMPTHSPVPSSGEAGQAGTCGTAVTRDLHGHQGATTRRRENVLREHSYLEEYMLFKKTR